MVDFLLIGPFSSISYPSIFSQIRKERILLGYNRVSEFTDGTKFASTIWFTSMDVEDHPPLDLVEFSGEYKEYDHFRAINIDRVCNIPDYDGVMGVPITFLERWCRRQFEIVDARDYRKDDSTIDMDVELLSSNRFISSVDGEPRYVRILIRRK